MFPTREQAKAAIMEGRVLFEGQIVEKAGALVDKECKIEVKESQKYVSRGGIKLEKALKDFKVGVNEKVVIDVGVSTGGFTDCLLKSGARLVIAVDVGYGQIALPLRNDPRVYLLERTNIRYLTPEKIPELADLATVDLSFISASKVIMGIAGLLKTKAELIILVKPQFEAGKECVGKKGVVRDPNVHRKVLVDLIDDFKGKNFESCSLTFSPILGAEGNIEFFLYLRKGFGDKRYISTELIDNVVSEAHLKLRKK
jgi:23S rRNA (cytidine1920-2'-O)/16S rRNA (cytidine1409-2'-O)-methyltransferase